MGRRRAGRPGCIVEERSDDDGTAAANITNVKHVLLGEAGREASIAEPSTDIPSPPAPPMPGLCGAVGVLQSGLAHGRGGNSQENDANMYENNDDGDDDSRQLHELLLLARLPYCRATKSIVPLRSDRQANVRSVGVGLGAGPIQPLIEETLPGAGREQRMPHELAHAEPRLLSQGTSIVASPKCRGC